MPLLNIPKTYKNSEIAFEADLDNFKDATETILNDTLLDEDNFKDDGITASTKFVAGSVTVSELANESITETRLATDSITTAKIIDESITTAKIADAAVTSAKLGAITTASGSDFDVTVTTSGATTSFSQSIGSVTITSTSGRPIIVTVAPDTNKVATILAGVNANNIGNAQTILFTLKRDTTYIAEFPVLVEYMDSTFPATDTTYIYLPASAIWFFDTGAAAGSNTYNLSVAGSVQGLNLNIKGKLFAYEMM